MIRIAYLATADARGHLMRAQLLTKALRADGASVGVWTTSDAGVRFLAGFGIEATLLSRSYAVRFDSRQNMRRGATDRQVAGYLLRPSRLLRDLGRLAAVLRDHDLVVDDSFHPALLVAGCLPGWRRKVVHVYGTSLRQALEANFSGRLWGWAARAFARVVAWLIDTSRARIDHDFAYDDAPCRVGNSVRLATPIAVVEAATSVSSPPPAAPPHATAAVYLNPHFSDPALAAALERGLAGAGLQASLVGEGYAGRPGWRAQDSGWVEQAATSDVVISAPGMAALSVALVYRRPIVLVLCDQPEQRANARRAAGLGLLHRTVAWSGDADAFAEAVGGACRELRDEAAGPVAAPTGAARAATRVHSWVTVLHGLAAA